MGPADIPSEKHNELTGRGFWDGRQGERDERERGDRERGGRETEREGRGEREEGEREKVDTKSVNCVNTGFTVYIYCMCVLFVCVCVGGWTDSLDVVEAAGVWFEDGGLADHPVQCDHQHH